MIKVETYDGRGYPVMDAHSKFKFPAGELQVSVRIKPHDFANILFEFENNEEIVELMLIVDAIKRNGGVVHNLVMPYVPFARQDRAANEGEAFSLKVFAEIINSLGAANVVVTDPHSDVTAALIDNLVIIPQEDIVHDIVKKYFPNEYFVLVSPDGGALKKIYKVAKKLQDNVIDIVECSKRRSTVTGEILGTNVHCEDLKGQACLIVDDITDGGRTFTEIAKILRQKDAGRIKLITSHGLYTKGLDVFYNIDEIYNRKGKVK
jgi:ribose-phosphate pyrophosphokinase